MRRFCEVKLECSDAESEADRFIVKEFDPTGSPKVALVPFCTASEDRFGDDVWPITANTKARITSTASNVKGIRLRRGTGTTLLLGLDWRAAFHRSALPQPGAARRRSAARSALPEPSNGS